MVVKSGRARVEMVRGEEVKGWETKGIVGLVVGKTEKG